jgi:RNA polymerase sigma factor (sigma-70 family)
MATPSAVAGVVRHLTAAADDADLLNRYVMAGDEGAFAALVQRYGGLVLGVARRQLADPGRAEDVFQATFLALARAAGRLRRQTPLANWLYTVALRQAKKARAGAARRDAAERSVPAAVAASADPLADISGRELLRVIDDELARLPDRYRLPVLLCCVQGLSRDEAAARLGWSAGAVKGRLERGRRVLADRLTARGLAPALVLAPLLTAVVPAELAARAVALAGSPWAKSIPAAVAALAAAGKPGWVWPAAVAAGVLAAGLGWVAVAGGPGPVAVRVMPGPAAVALPAVPAPVVARDQPADPAADRPAAPLPDRAVLRFGSARFRHPTGILSLAYAPDARWAVAGSGGGVYTGCDRSYDLTDGRALARYGFPDHPAEAVAVSPDGATVLTRSSYTYRLFDPPTGRERRKFDLPDPKGHYGTQVLLFTPDGRHAVSAYGTESGLVMVDLGAGRIVRRFPFDPKALQVVAAAVSPDGKYLAAVADAPFAREGSGRVWEVETGREVRRFDAGVYHSNMLQAAPAAFSPDGRLLATGAAEGKAQLYEVATGRTVHTFPVRGAVSAAFAPDGRTVAFAGVEQITVFDTETGRGGLTIGRRATHLRFAADGKSLVGAVGNALVRWDAATGRPLTPDGPGGRPVERLLVSPDGRRLMTVGADREADVWDTRTGGRVDGRRVTTARSVGFLPDGQLTGGRSVYAALPDQSLIVTVDTPTMTAWVFDRAKGPPERSFSLLRPDERKVWEDEQRARVHVDPFPTALSLDGRVLASGYYRAAATGPIPFVRLWDVATGRERAELPAGTTHNALAFSPDGRLLVTGMEPPAGFLPEPERRAKNAIIWKLATGRPVPWLPRGLAPGALAAAFSPDGRVLATGNTDGTVTLWEVATWGVRATLRGHGDRVNALAFGPDGRLYSGSSDCTALAWEVRPAKTGGGSPDAAWKGLADPDAGKAFAAMGRLVGSPTEAVELLARRLMPAVAPDPAAVAKLIADLGSDDFATRERAEKELNAVGRVAAGPLREAARSASAEVRARAARVLGRSASDLPSPEEVQATRAVEVLEAIGTPAARDLLGKLATGNPGAVLTREAAATLGRIK